MPHGRQRTNAARPGARGRGSAWSARTRHGRERAALPAYETPARPRPAGPTSDYQPSTASLTLAAVFSYATSAAMLARSMSLSRASE